MNWHTYPANRAGYFSDDEINLPRFPVRLFSAICPRCLSTVFGPLSGLLVVNEREGDKVVGRILDNHVCSPISSDLLSCIRSEVER